MLHTVDYSAFDEIVTQRKDLTDFIRDLFQAKLIYNIYSIETMGNLLAEFNLTSIKGQASNIPEIWHVLYNFLIHKFSKWQVD